MEVRLVYQPYTENMAIFLGEKPIGMVSALSRYQTLPFAQWYSEILQAIAFEVNDSFTLTYVGRKCEYRVLNSLLPVNPLCRGMRYEKPLLGDSALLRLKKLSRFVMNGVPCPKTTVPLTVYTDMDLTEVDTVVRGVLPKFSFCRLSLSVQNVQEISDAKKHQSIAFIKNRIEAVTGRTAGVVCLGNGREGFENETAVLYAEQEGQATVLSELLELVIWPSLLKKMLAAISVPEDSPFFTEIFILDKTEPQCFVSLPKSIELGDSVAVQVTTIPRGNHKPKIYCRVSNDTVITYENGSLKAVGTGEAVVEVYESGKITPMYSSTVTAFRRNRIQKIQLQPLRLSMCVGETSGVRYSCQPTNADNFGTLKLLSEDGTIVGIAGNEKVLARRTGRCYVYYQAEKVESNICDITVYPRLEKLSILAENDRIPVNTMTKVQITRTPKDATLDNLDVTVEPAELGTYDVGSGSFFARKAGSGRLIVKSSRNGVEASVPIRVTQERKLPIKPILIAAAALAVIWLLKTILG